MWQVHQRTVSVLGASLAVLFGMLLAGPAAAGAATGCRAVDTRDGAVHHRLQRAINHAASGDTLLVRGTCVGSFSVLTSLTLRGVPSGGSVRATLDGGGAGSVLMLAADNSVVLENLIVQHGFALDGGGIDNQSDILTLRHTLVRHNRAQQDGVGGGIYSNGSVILEHSSVQRNLAGLGGGIYSSLLTVLRHSTIAGNRAATGAGGGIFSEFGETQLIDSSISGNRATFSAGGMDIDGGFLVLAGSTTITGNTLINTSYPGAGGLGAFGDSSAKSADGTSAFVDWVTGAVLPAWTGSVSGNVPTDCYNGGGIFTIACG